MMLVYLPVLVITSIYTGADLNYIDREGVTICMVHKRFILFMGRGLW